MALDKNKTLGDKQMPKRYQRKRTKGWRMPLNTIYVGRGSVWGNPYKVIKKESGGYEVKLTGCGRHRRTQKDYHRIFKDKVAAMENSVEMYKTNVAPYYHGLSLQGIKGKNLACWCRFDQPCHADVLLELANKD